MKKELAIMSFYSNQMTLPWCRTKENIEKTTEALLVILEKMHEAIEMFGNISIIDEESISYIFNTTSDLWWSVSSKTVGSESKWQEINDTLVDIEDQAINQKSISLKQLQAVMTFNYKALKLIKTI